MKLAQCSLAVIACLICCFSITSARTWYITPEGFGDAPTIQAGIDSASNGDVVLLADGTYAGAGNHEIDYKGKAILVKSQSGDPASCIIDCENAWRGVYFRTGEGSGSILEGVTITRGHGGHGGYGGNVYCDGTFPTLRDCRITNGSAAWGGGILSDSSRPTLVRCSVRDNNAAYSGAAVYGSIDCIECEFTGNTSVHGGAIDGQAGLENCTFISNSALDGNGGAVRGRVEATNCTFISNSAFYDGGVIEGYGVFVDCTFLGNFAQRGGVVAGGGEFTNCTLSENGAYPGSGAVHVTRNSRISLDRTIIAFGVWGVAIQCDEASTGEVTCCDIYGNEGGDWVGCLAGGDGIHGNFSLDPEFCGVPGNLNPNFYLQSDSPCAPGNHPNAATCDLIGRMPVGCGVVKTEVKTWGAIKEMYRSK